MEDGGRSLTPITELTTPASMRTNIPLDDDGFSTRTPSIARYRFSTATLDPSVFEDADEDERGTINGDGDGDGDEERTFGGRGRGREDPYDGDADGNGDAMSDASHDTIRRGDDSEGEGSQGDKDNGDEASSATSSTIRQGNGGSPSQETPEAAINHSNHSIPQPLHHHLPQNHPLAHTNHAPFPVLNTHSNSDTMDWIKSSQPTFVSVESSISRRVQPPEPLQLAQISNHGAIPTHSHAHTSQPRAHPHFHPAPAPMPSSAPTPFAHQASNHQGHFAHVPVHTPQTVAVPSLPQMQAPVMHFPQPHFQHSSTGYTSALLPPNELRAPPPPGGEDAESPGRSAVTPDFQPVASFAKVPSPSRLTPGGREPRHITPPKTVIPTTDPTNPTTSSSPTTASIANKPSAIPIPTRNRRVSLSVPVPVPVANISPFGPASDEARRRYVERYGLDGNGKRESIKAATPPPKPEPFKPITGTPRANLTPPSTLGVHAGANKSTTSVNTPPVTTRPVGFKARRMSTNSIPTLSKMTNVFKHSPNKSITSKPNFSASSLHLDTGSTDSLTLAPGNGGAGAVVNPILVNGTTSKPKFRILGSAPGSTATSPVVARHQTTEALATESRNNQSASDSDDAGIAGVGAVMSSRPPSVQGSRSRPNSWLASRPPSDLVDPRKLDAALEAEKAKNRLSAPSLPFHPNTFTTSIPSDPFSHPSLHNVPLLPPDLDFDSSSDRRSSRSPFRRSMDRSRPSSVVSSTNNSPNVTPSGGRRLSLVGATRPSGLSRPNSFHGAGGAGGAEGISTGNTPSGSPYGSGTDLFGLGRPTEMGAADMTSFRIAAPGVVKSVSAVDVTTVTAMATTTTAPAVSRVVKEDASIQAMRHSLDVPRPYMTSHMDLPPLNIPRPPSVSPTPSEIKATEGVDSSNTQTNVNANVNTNPTTMSNTNSTTTRLIAPPSRSLSRSQSQPPSSHPRVQVFPHPPPLPGSRFDPAAIQTPITAPVLPNDLLSGSGGSTESTPEVLKTPAESHTVLSPPSSPTTKTRRNSKRGVTSIFSAIFSSETTSTVSRKESRKERGRASSISGGIGNGSGVNLPGVGSSSRANSISKNRRMSTAAREVPPPLPSTPGESDDPTRAAPVSVRLSGNFGIRDDGSDVLTPKTMSGSPTVDLPDLSYSLGLDLGLPVTHGQFGPGAHGEHGGLGGLGPGVGMDERRPSGSGSVVEPNLRRVLYVENAVDDYAVDDDEKEEIKDDVEKDAAEEAKTLRDNLFNKVVNGPGHRVAVPALYPEAKTGGNGPSPLAETKSKSTSTAPTRALPAAPDEDGFSASTSASGLGLDLIAGEGEGVAVVAVAMVEATATATATFDNSKSAPFVAPTITTTPPTEHTATMSTAAFPMPPQVKARASTPAPAAPAPPTSPTSAAPAPSATSTATGAPTAAGPTSPAGPTFNMPTSPRALLGLLGQSSPRVTQSPIEISPARSISSHSHDHSERPGSNTHGRSSSNSHRRASPAANGSLSPMLRSPRPLPNPPSATSAYPPSSALTALSASGSGGLHLPPASFGAYTTTSFLGPAGLTPPPTHSAPGSALSGELPMLVASHLLSTHASALMRQSDAMRQVGETMRRMANESMEWGAALGLTPSALASAGLGGGGGIGTGGAVDGLPMGSKHPYALSGEHTQPTDGFTPPRPRQSISRQTSRSLSQSSLQAIVNGTSGSPTQRTHSLSTAPPAPSAGANVHSHAHVHAPHMTPALSHSTSHSHSHSYSGPSSHSHPAHSHLQAGVGGVNPSPTAGSYIAASFLREAERMGKEGWASMRSAEDVWTRAMSELRVIVETPQALAKESADYDPVRVEAAQSYFGQAYPTPAGSVTHAPAHKDDPASTAQPTFPVGQAYVQGQGQTVNMLDIPHALRGLQNNSAISLPSSYSVPSLPSLPYPQPYPAYPTAVLGHFGNESEPAFNVYPQPSEGMGRAPVNAVPSFYGRGGGVDVSGYSEGQLHEVYPGLVAGSPVDMAMANPNASKVSFHPDTDEAHPVNGTERLVPGNGSTVKRVSISPTVTTAHTTRSVGSGHGHATSASLGGGPNSIGAGAGSRTSTAMSMSSSMDGKDVARKLSKRRPSVSVDNKKRGWFGLRKDSGVAA